MNMEIDDQTGSILIVRTNLVYSDFLYSLSLILSDKIFNQFFYSYFKLWDFFPRGLCDNHLFENIIFFLFYDTMREIFKSSAKFLVGQFGEWRNFSRVNIKSQKFLSRFFWWQKDSPRKLRYFSVKILSKIKNCLGFFRTLYSDSFFFFVLVHTSEINKTCLSNHNSSFVHIINFDFS